MIKRICVFCGSNNGERPEYVDAARAMGIAIARRGMGLVYGGGRVGLMGAVADAALAEGGEVIGVIPEALMAREVAHGRLTELRVVRSMHERKALMAELSDAFLTLPGGYGTLEEFCEVITWAQLGLHAKPCGILNVHGYYDMLLNLFDQAVTQGFVRREQRSIILEEKDPERMLDLLLTYRPPALRKWIDEDET